MYTISSKYQLRSRSPVCDCRKPFVSTSAVQTTITPWAFPFPVLAIRAHCFLLTKQCLLVTLSFSFFFFLFCILLSASFESCAFALWLLFGVLLRCLLAEAKAWLDGDLHRKDRQSSFTLCWKCLPYWPFRCTWASFILCARAYNGAICVYTNVSILNLTYWCYR